MLAAFAKKLASDGGMTEQQIKQHINDIHASVDQGVRGMMLSIPNQRQMEEALNQHRVHVMEYREGYEAVLELVQNMDPNITAKEIQAHLADNS